MWLSMPLTPLKKSSSSLSSPERPYWTLDVDPGTACDSSPLINTGIISECRGALCPSRSTILSAGTVNFAKMRQIRSVPHLTALRLNLCDSPVDLVHWSLNKSLLWAPEGWVLCSVCTASFCRNKGIFSAKDQFSLLVQMPITTCFRPTALHLPVHVCEVYFTKRA